MTRPRSWWGERWAEAVSLAAPAAAPRGKGRPKGARLRSLDPKSGEATVEVATTSVLPYEVRISVAPIPEGVWSKATASLSRSALVAAKLLAGDLPTEVEDAFVAAGGSLFPRPGEVRVKCNCQAGSSCRHGAIAERALAEAIDRDPFLLFDLRGRPRSQLLAELGVRPKEVSSTEDVAPASLPALDPATFRRPRGDLGTLHFHIAPPEVPLALLTRLGDPPGWRSPPTFSEGLGPVVQGAAAKAREIALGEDAKPQTGKPST